MLFWVLIIFALSFTVYLIVAAIYGAHAPNDLAPTPIQLNTQTQLLTSEQVSSTLTGSGCTVAGFFNVTMGDRTTHYQNSDVTNYTTLIGVPNMFEFQLAAAGVSMNDYSARLRIITGGNRNTVEYLELPPMPQQKWIFLCILRDGRRFDVLYNDQIVGSHRLDEYPNVASGGTLQVAPTVTPSASSRFLGTAVHLFAMNYRMLPADLAIMRAQNSDTTGAPPPALSFPLPSFFAIPDLRFFCIPGLPCAPVTQPLPNRMKMWTSIYN